MQNPASATNSRIDDDLCQCFHVSARKIIRFIQQTQPRVASQISQCYGAGTGCGWCRPSLELLASAAAESRAQGVTQLDSQALANLLPSADDCQNSREMYLAERAAGTSADHDTSTDA